MRNWFKSGFVMFIIVSAALLLMATAVYAPATTLPPCSNGIQDGDETGVDCGGRCASPSFIELCDGKDNDQDCMVDEACKNWPSGKSAIPVKQMPDNYKPNLPSSGGSGAGRTGERDVASSSPSQGYEPFKVPVQSGDGSSDSGSVGPASSAEAQPQKAPEQEPLKSIPQDQAANGSSAVPAEEVPGEIPQQVGGTVSGSSAPSASSNVQKAGSSSSGKEKAGKASVKSQSDKESPPNTQGKPNALVRFGRFFRKLFS